MWWPSTSTLFYERHIPSLVEIILCWTDFHTVELSHLNCLQNETLG